MTRYNLVASVFLRAKCDRGDDPALFDTLNKLVHILINFHLEGMVGKIINLRDGNIENARELVYLAFLVICEQLIVSSQAQVDFLHVLQSLSPPS